MDRLVEDLHRRILQDPDDDDLRISYLSARARVEGPDAYLDPLKDREHWNNLSHRIQDIAIEEVARRLPEGFKHVNTQTFECECKVERKCLDKASNDMTIRYRASKTYSHRIARFKHRHSGINLLLLPAGYFDKPDGNATRHVSEPIPPYEMPVDENDIDHLFMEDPDLRQIRTRVKKPFLIGQTPVGSQQGTALLHDVGRRIPKVEGGDLSYVGQDWEPVKIILERHGMRLPNAHEWEYASAAGTESFYYFGSDVPGNDHRGGEDHHHAWYSINYSASQYGGLQPNKVHLKSKSWNSFGLTDTVGNCLEYLENKNVLAGFTAWASGFYDQNPDGYLVKRPSLISREVDTDLIGFRAAMDIPQE